MAKVEITVGQISRSKQQDKRLYNVKGLVTRNTQVQDESHVGFG